MALAGTVNLLASELTKRQTKQKELLEQVDVAMSLVRDTAASLGKADSFDWKQPHSQEQVEELKRIAARFAACEHHINMRDLGIGKTRNELVSGAKQPDGLDWKTVFNEAAAAEAAKPANMALQQKREQEAVRAVMVRAWEVKHHGQPLPGDDADLADIEGAVNITCPITKMDLEEAVKNTCGHAYSRAAILDLIKQKQDAKRACVCPVAGCKVPVSQDSLSTDVEKRREVDRRQKAAADEEKKRASGGGQKRARDAGSAAAAGSGRSPKRARTAKEEKQAATGELADDEVEEVDDTQPSQRRTRGHGVGSAPRVKQEKKSNAAAAAAAAPMDDDVSQSQGSQGEADLTQRSQ